MAIEGDYSSWTYKWKYDYSVTPPPSDSYAVILAYTSTKVIIAQDAWYEVHTRNISNGLNATILNEDITTVINRFGERNFSALSVLGKYFATVDNEGDGKNRLKVYKDGVLTETIDLSAAPTSWGLDSMLTSMTPDGKYIIVDNSGYEFALFEGS